MTDAPLSEASATFVPAADVQVPPIDAGSIVHQAFPLRQPEEDAHEILVRVRGTSLRRIRKRLGTLLTSRFPWAETFLGLSTLSFGGSLGALASNMPWATIDGKMAVANSTAIVFYVMLPVVGAASAVAYFFLRHFVARNASEVASACLEELPDPDRAL